MRAVIVTGPPGAGKTTVLAALANALAEEDVRHAAVEVEALAWTHPWPDDDAATTHLTLLARSFRDRGYPLLLVGVTAEGREHLAEVVGASAADEVLVVSLSAPVAVLRERITRREPPEWNGLSRLLEACDALAAANEDLVAVDLALTTENREPAAVAATIRQAMNAAFAAKRRGAVNGG